ncbi:uncharacterized protein LOC134187145 [Corticium candelabrum]|uniref:uncharacterized protein LOC134187145 n=1 Tax=Corticium candelabrum TaxID=121492 RepID=UPI002E26FCFC|nr:uncharacterized protein LOC134187145 [Corticium candelabrum]
MSLHCRSFDELLDNGLASARLSLAGLVIHSHRVLWSRHTGLSITCSQLEEQSTQEQDVDIDGAPILNEFEFDASDVFDNASTVPESNEVSDVSVVGVSDAAAKNKSDNCHNDFESIASEDNVSTISESKEGDFYDPSIERRIEFGPAKDSLEGVKTVESSEDEYQYVCVLSDDSVINSSTVQCASEIVTSDDDTRDGWLGTSAQHVQRRKRALVHYKQAAQNQIKKQTRNKRVRLQAHLVGEYVTIKIPTQDRTSDLPRLPAVIVEVKGTKRFSYRLRSLHGVIDRLYDESTLEKYSGKIEGLDDNNWQSDSQISLREQQDWPDQDKENV